MAVKYIPAGYTVLTPSCALVGCDRAIELYRKVFGAEQIARHDTPDGKVAHCELRFGDSNIMMGEADPAHGVKPTTMQLMMYVPDCDATVKRATGAGFTLVEAPKDQFYGDRNARLTDPFGNGWFIGTHIEDVSEEELKKRMAKLAGG
jgi:PhnB protein